MTVVPGQTFNGTLPLSSQPSAVELYFMHELEEFGEQELVAVIAVETSPGMIVSLELICILTSRLIKLYS